MISGVTNYATHTHMHTQVHARARTHTHTHTHTPSKNQQLPWKRYAHDAGIAIIATESRV